MFGESSDVVFYEISALLLLTSLLGFIAIQLKQPLIMAFIFAGIILGSPLIPLEHLDVHMSLLSGMGISILLFLVGLKLDIAMVRKMGRVALATGIGQILFTSIVGFLISYALGMNVITSFYVAIALTFSSTIIIVKLLSDKRELDSLHGRIAIGFLIVQDIFVILAMIFVSSFLIEGEQSVANTLLFFSAKAIGIFVFFFVVTRYVLPRLLRVLARSPELLVLFAISWAVALAAGCHYLELSKEIGAFLAGFSIASTEYREAIGARLVSLRDFLLLFFFIDLGMSLDLSLLGLQLTPAIILSVFVLIGNPIIVMIIMGFMGYRKRTGFLAGLTVAQISEFSLVLIALGLASGHIGTEALGLVTLVGIVTISTSTYMILYSQQLFNWLSPWLSVFERKSVPDDFEDRHRDEAVTSDVILFGLGRYGTQLSRQLRERGYTVLGVDLDPLQIERFQKAGVATRYGDATDLEYPESLPLSQTKWVISTISDAEVNRILAKSLAQHQFPGKLALTAHRHRDAHEIRPLNPDVIFFPFADAAHSAIDQLEQMWPKPSS